MEGIFSLFDLALIAVIGVGLFASLVLCGGAKRNAPAVVTVACYTIATGLAVSVVPQIRWPVARQDNAFIGNILLTLLAVVAGLVLLLASTLSTERGQRARTVAVSGVLALSAAVMFVGVLLTRGPGAWRTGFGQFDTDVILFGVAVGAVLFALMRRQPAPPKASASQHA